MPAPAMATSKSFPDMLFLQNFNVARRAFVFSTGPPETAL
jgi:hypothetical protein